MTGGSPFGGSQDSAGGAKKVITLLHLVSRAAE